MITVYISIGNSDDKLSQKDWAEFIASVGDDINKDAVAIHGLWFSQPASPFQNACWCIEVAPEAAQRLRGFLSRAALAYGQDSIAWAVADTEFIKADGGTPA